MGRKNHKSPKHAKRQEDRRANSNNVSLDFEGMVPQLRAEFLRRTGRTQIDLLHPRPQLLYGRVQAVKRTVRTIVPADVRVRIRVSAEFQQSVANLQPERFSSGQDYTTTRGANIATAKTIPASDGSFDIVLNAERFISAPEDSDQEVSEKTAQLTHLAAHEPQHILMHLDRTDSCYYLDEVPVDSVGRKYRGLFGEPIDEPSWIG